jgi:phenylacetate-CoA ligase
MSNQSIYWNPVLETLPYEKIRKLQLKKFQRIFSWAYEHSKFHRTLYDNDGIKPKDIQSFSDIKQIPTVEKSMMRDIQGKEPFPYGDALCVPLNEVTAYRQTSGTTGQPVYQPDTWQDWEWWAECWAQLLWAQGYRPKDRVFIPFGYNVFVAFWAGHYGAEKIGCEVVPGGVLDTRARILKIQELNPTAMMGTPTYMLGMADTAINKMKLNPADLSIEIITCAGEPGASIPSTKKRIEDAWGAKVYDHAGATEIGAWSFECTEQPGSMHVNDAFFLVEIVDVETGEAIETPGVRGKMIITALDRQAQPCIRFDSKDIIEWDTKICTCGRSSKLIKGGVVGRTDDITKVKGVLFSPSSVENVVRGIEGLGNDYELKVEKINDRDKITLQVEFVQNFSEEMDKIKSKLSDQLRLKTNLNYEIEFCQYGELPRYPVKAKRFKDLRK